MTLQLTPDETALLRELLEAKLRELQHELHHTDDRGFKQVLRARREVVEALLGRLEPVSA